MTQATQIIVPILTDAIGISPYRIAMTSTVNLDRVVQANAASSGGFGFALLGVTGEIGIDSNSIGDLTVTGIGYVKTNQGGMPIASPITSDALGQGVLANTAGQKYVGFLLEPAINPGQICKILVCPGVF